MIHKGGRFAGIIEGSFIKNANKELKNANNKNTASYIFIDF